MDGSDGSWLELVQTVSLCGRQLRKALAEIAAPRGLSDTDCLVLWACQNSPPLGQAQHDLVGLVGVSPAQLSGLLENLSERGWMAGKRPPRDRRRQYWKLLPAGEALLADIMRELAAWSTRSTQLLPQAERDLLLRRLKQLTFASTLPANATTRQEAA